MSYNCTFLDIIKHTFTDFDELNPPLVYYQSLSF